MTDDERYVVRAAIDECERAARFIEGQTPESLRAWAARSEDFERNGINGVSLPSLTLRSMAKLLTEICE